MIMYALTRMRKRKKTTKTKLALTNLLTKRR